MKLSPDSLQRHLERQLLPVYLVSGDEPLLATEAADAIRGRARALGFTEREVHVLDRGTDWDAVRAAAGTLSLFAARRIVELRLPTGKPGVTGGRVLASLAASADADTLILILTGRLDRESQNAEWVRTVEARGGWVQIWPIGADRMMSWLEARCRELGLAADRRALELLAERTEGNLLAARGELEKLKLLGSERLTPERVLAAAGDSARFSVGELSDALAAGEGARALRVLSGLRAEGVELPLVLWAVARALRTRWSRELESGLHPARARAIRSSYRGLIARAVRADGMAKGRRSGDAWDEIALLVCDLAGRAALPLPSAQAV
ncbi:MAG TPA: DNA polymerase III subunit delta [Steroidobacteraceae bacterium]|nr:DNA polymerase III subunit delta [Steroidobacteraceae bacterium]